MRVSPAFALLHCENMLTSASFTSWNLFLARDSNSCHPGATANNLTVVNIRNCGKSYKHTDPQTITDIALQFSN